MSEKVSFVSEDIPDDTPNLDTRRLVSPVDLFEESLARKVTIVPVPLAGLRKAINGGFETRRNIVISAPAGGGKTGLLMQCAAHAVTHGEFFAVLALKDGDQWSDGMRLAQMAGVDRFELRDRKPEAIEKAREAMRRYGERIMFYDVTRPGASLTNMLELAKPWVRDRGHMLLGTDSVHVFPVDDREKEMKMPIYDRIGYRLEALHEHLGALDAVGITVGQSGRASYSRKRDEENTDLLTAVSGGHVAENTVDVLIVTTKPNDDDLRYLVIPKSRIGGQGARIPVRYDEERSLWRDAEPGEGVVEAKEQRTKEKGRLKEEEERKARETLISIIKERPGTVQELSKIHGRNPRWVTDVVGDFRAKGWIHLEQEARKDSRERAISVPVWTWTS